VSRDENPTRFNGMKDEKLLAIHQKLVVDNRNSVPPVIHEGIMINVPRTTAQDLMLFTFVKSHCALLLSFIESPRG